MASPLNDEKLVELYNEEVAARSNDIASNQTIQVNLLDIRLGTQHEPKLVREDDRIKVVVQADANGIEFDHPWPEPKVILVDPATVIPDEATTAQEHKPFKPRGARVSFPPTAGEELKADRRKDRPSVIFGGDDRIVFHDPSFPWGCIGKIRTAAGRASGCMIGPRHVLTASHCVNWGADGTAGWITFSPGYYDRQGPWGTFAAVNIYSWMQNRGALSDQQTAFDYAVLVLDERIGDTIGHFGIRRFSDSWVNTVSNWKFVGYPEDLTDTERPVYQNTVKITSKQDFTFNGRQGCVLGHFNDNTAGMSGGPAFATWADDAGPRVVGVCSTREGAPIAVPDGSTASDNEFGGGPALSELVTHARNEMP